MLLFVLKVGVKWVWGTLNVGLFEGFGEKQPSQ